MPNRIYNGTVVCPSSKSYMQRALAIALLKSDSTKILNPSYCQDAKALLDIVEKLGFRINIHPDCVALYADEIQNKNCELNFRESGLGIRMLSPILASKNTCFIMHGSGSLTTRPITMIEDGLNQLGVSVKTNNGILPIEIQGPIKNQIIHIDGTISSQFLSGLLIVAPTLKRNFQISVTNLRSKPYIDMTIEMMKQFGVMVQHENYAVFNIKGSQKYSNSHIEIEGDWSSAAFHLVGAAISGKVRLSRIKMESLQADKKIIDVLDECGAQIIQKENEIEVQKKELNSFEFDATDCPDLFPALAVLAVACKGQSKIKGIHRLAHKESNRAETIQSELHKLGVKISLDYDNDSMNIFGSQVSGGKISSNNDHRIAMMAAIASLIATNPIELENPSSVNKSYPNFFKDFMQATIV